MHIPKQQRNLACLPLAVQIKTFNQVKVNLCHTALIIIIYKMDQSFFYLYITLLIAVDCGFMQSVIFGLGKRIRTGWIQFHDVNILFS